jgi:hypothetical protein
MSFGKESSFVFFMQDGILVNVGRSDTDATKQPLDDVELEVWRIFHEHRILKQSHERLLEYVRHHKDCRIDIRIPMSGDTEPCTCGLDKVLKATEEVK